MATTEVTQDSLPQAQMGFSKLEEETAPPVMQQMSRAPLQPLESSRVVALYQDVLGTGKCSCGAVQNRYKICSVPQEKLSAMLMDAEMRQMPELFDVREDPAVPMRCWCSIWRTFRLGVFPADVPDVPFWPSTEPLIVLERPMKCTSWWGTLVEPQQIYVTVNGSRVGHVEQEVRCPDCLVSGNWWTRVFDAQGNVVHMVRAPGQGSNFMAPSCCHLVYEMDVFNAGNEHNRIGVLKNIWRGCIDENECAVPSDSNFVLEFPEGASLEQKGLLIGALFLQDFTCKVKFILRSRKQKNKPAV